MECHFCNKRAGNIDPILKVPFCDKICQKNHYINSNFKNGRRQRPTTTKPPIKEDEQMVKAKNELNDWRSRFRLKENVLSWNNHLILTVNQYVSLAKKVIDRNPTPEEIEQKERLIKDIKKITNWSGWVGSSLQSNYFSYIQSQFFDLDEKIETISKDLDNGLILPDDAIDKCNTIIETYLNANDSWREKDPFYNELLLAINR